MMKITFSPNARLVLEKRYLDKDPSGKIIETPEEMMRRVARHVAEGDRAFESSEVVTQSEASFFDLLSKLWFVPNSPTLMNAGRRLGQLAACFVLPVGDSIESIFDAVKHTAIIHKSGLVERDFPFHISGRPTIPCRAPQGFPADRYRLSTFSIPPPKR